MWREHARKLALENEALHDQVRRTEKDTVEVLGFLKGQDEHKDDEVSKAYCLDLLGLELSVLYLYIFTYYEIVHTTQSIHKIYKANNIGKVLA